MAERLSEIASDKEGNAHFFQAVHECKRTLRIGARVGPKHRDLKREGFWKLLEWVGRPVHDVEQGHFFSSQGRLGLGGRLPNVGRPTQTQHEKHRCQGLFQARILKTLTKFRGDMDVSMRYARRKHGSGSLGPTVQGGSRATSRQRPSSSLCAGRTLAKKLKNKISLTTSTLTTSTLSHARAAVCRAKPIGANNPRLRMSFARL